MDLDRAECRAPAVGWTHERRPLVNSSAVSVEQDHGDLQDRVGFGPQATGLEIDDREDRFVEVRAGGKRRPTPAEHAVTLGVGGAKGQTRTR